MTIKTRAASASAILIIVFFPIAVSGKNYSMGSIAEVFNELKKTKEIRYNYEMSIEYPGSRKEQINGIAYINNDEKLLFNSNEVFTMIYGNHWFYKANNKEKSVTITNLDKDFKPQEKKKLEDDLFKNNSLAIFLDSVLLKYGKLQSYDKQKDIVHAEITFSMNSIKKVSIVFDEQKKLIKQYSIVTSQPDDENRAEIIQTVTCNNFKKQCDKRKYSADKFFQIKEGKVVLIKYPKYKLYSKL